jgi:hypothetical protein
VKKYELGYNLVALDLAAGEMGGSFWLLKNDIGPVIKVGLNYEKWESVVAVAFHEAMEFALTQLRCRYTPSNELAGDHGSYVFWFDHVTFSEACYMASEFVTFCFDDLKQAWEANRPNGVVVVNT